MNATRRLGISLLLLLSGLVPAGSALALPPGVPAVNWPAEGESVNMLLVRYDLPEEATAGSVKLVFSGAASSTVTLTGSLQGSPTVSLVAANLANSTGVSNVTGAQSLPDGAYTVVLQYTDLASSPKSSAPRNFVLDTVTLAPRLLSPLNSSANPTTIFSVAFTLPEAPLAGATKVILHPTAGGNGDHVITLNRYAIAEGVVSILRPYPLFPMGVASVTPSGAIAAGVYDVSISYQDSVGNPPAKRTATGVLLGDWTPPARTRIGLTKPKGGHLKLRGGRVAVAVTLNGAGTVNLIARNAKGKAVGSARVTFASAGRKRVTITLNTATRRALARARQAGIKLTVRATATAKGKTAGKATLAVRLVS